ncbi:hypothetical protein H8S37_02315 [Mediterraneibacter sp. NSJ-55]|uniref:Uncharacterized protein n=1 Tax=Mediterraneibacter hominis TaxID=2763054 RepID=A0A923LGQ1_9FIRM|nr:hypothetical protein [Mediterraneibacter hominis]MBC5687771.1 hypothetical protein [Mediterraneibacter hominis]
MFYHCLAAVTVFLTACGGNSGGTGGEESIQGVDVTEDGEVSVTFKIPKGLSAAEVLGCRIGPENVMHVTDVEKEQLSESRTVYWYELPQTEETITDFLYYLKTAI